MDNLCSIFEAVISTGFDLKLGWNSWLTDSSPFVSISAKHPSLLLLLLDDPIRRRRRDDELKVIGRTTAAEDSGAGKNQAKWEKEETEKDAGGRRKEKN